MIKIRDSAAGVFKHRHIGQVIVPISCFIYQTEATFTLPLEATSKMEITGRQNTAVGQIQLTTQLISLQERSKDGSDARQGVIKRPGNRPLAANSTSRVSREVGAVDGTGNFTVSESTLVSIGFNLHKASPWSVWWPMRMLQNVECRGHVCLK
jgi:hypothetical protein